MAVLAPAAASALPARLGEFSQIDAVAQTPSGKILVGGGTQDCVPFFSTCTTPSGSALIGRFTASGELDPSFGDDGGLIVDGPPPAEHETNQISDIGAQPDGKVIAELYGNPGGGAGRALALERFDAGGSRDMSFGSNGEVELPTGAAPRFVVDPDGKIVVLANTESAQNSQRSVTLERYTADGEPDPSFGTAGASEYLQSTDDDSIYAIDLRRDSEGRYVVLTEGSSGFYEDTLDVLRVDSSGALDTTFGGGDGYAQAVGPGAEILYSGGIAIAPDDGVLVGFNISSSEFHTCNGRGIVRLASDGAIDTSYGGGGAGFDNLFACSGVQALSTTDDGSLYSVGTGFTAESSPYIALTRLSPGGFLDTDFGNRGGVRTPPPAAESHPADVIAEADGGVLVAGRAGSAGHRCVGGNPHLLNFSCEALLLARYDKSGKRVADFGHNGFSVVPRFSTCRLREARGRLILPDKGRRLSIKLHYRSYRSSRVTAQLRKARFDKTTLFNATTQRSDEPVALSRTRILEPSELSALRSHPESLQITFNSFNDRTFCRLREDLTPVKSGGSGTLLFH